MSTADRIGLLPGLGWLFAGRGFWATFGICMLVSPLGLWIVQLCIERRPISLKREDNYLSFFPGDVFLGLAATGFLMLAQQLPDEQRWYNSVVWHIIVMLCCAIGGLMMLLTEYRRGQYTIGEILTPTKLYHDVGLYVGYGSVIVSTGIAVIFGGVFFSRWTCALLVVIGLLVWGFLFWFDQNALSQTQRNLKSAATHQADWRSNWRPRKAGTQDEPAELSLGMLPTFNSPPHGDGQVD